MGKCTVDIVAVERAADASFLPARPEHEVVCDQLALSAKQLSQRLFAVRAFEHVSLSDFFPWQLTALARDFITQAREFLLIVEELFAPLQPDFRADDFVVLQIVVAGCFGHVVLPSS